MTLHSKHSKPKILISKCLEFSACRYDGKIIKNNIIGSIIPWFECIPVCPEVEIGLGIPRDPVDIIIENNKPILYQEKMDKNLTSKINSFADVLLKEKIFDGFILKSKSPSCGLNTAKIYSGKEKSHLIRKGSGIFTTNIIEKFPYHPKIEEQDLYNEKLRTHFFTAIFVLADFRSIKNTDQLHKFHKKHIYLLMTYNKNILHKMKNIAINMDKEDQTIVLKSYNNALLQIFKNCPSQSSNKKTLMHIFEYFKDKLTKNEKTDFLNQFEEYNSKRIPLKRLKNILLNWATLHKDTYLLNQSYLKPFPLELSNIN